MAAAAPDAATLQHVSNLLSVLTQPDTNAIRQAEGQLKPLLKQPATMSILWHLISTPNTTDPVVRQVAATLLRKRLPGHFESWDAPTQNQWQHQVLQHILQETIQPVRSALIASAASLFSGPPNPTLLQFLEGAVGAGATPRECAYRLLSELVDGRVDWTAHVQSIHVLCNNALTNTNETAATQRAAIQALGSFLSYWSDDAEPMQGLLPLLPQMLHVAAAQQDEEVLQSVLEVLYDLAYASYGVDQILPVSLEFCGRLLAHRELDLNVRDAAALAIATNAETKPKTFAKHTALLRPLVDTLFQLMQESTASAAGALLEGARFGNEEEEDDDPAGGPTEMSIAQGTLDGLACELPTPVIWEICYPLCVRLCQSPDAAARKAGVAGLGVITEGCAEPLTEQLPTILPAVLSLTQDAAAPVRECACFCLGQMSEFCQPDILAYSEQILPSVFRLLDDATASVQTTSCYVLEIFCEQLEPKAVRPVLDALVRKLGGMLTAPGMGRVKEMVLAAMAATAVAAEAEFTPYVADVAQILQPFMTLTTEDSFTLRGRALECMGHIAIAVGKDAFRPYLEATVQCAMEGCQFDSTDLQEFAFAVFANVAKPMKEEFAPALPQLVPYLISIVEQDEGQLEKAAPTNATGFSGLDDSDDEDEENFVVHVRTALLDVKKGAITALGEFASYTGTHYCPHLEATMKVFQQAAKNWHPLIKLEAADAMPSLVKPSIAAYHGGKVEWKKGDPNSAPLSNHTQAIAGAVLQELIALVNDEEMNVVAKALEGIQRVIELCGPASFANLQQPILEASHKILIKASPCQVPSPLFELVDEDDVDFTVIVDAACSVLVSFAKIQGPQFAQYLNQFLPPIIEYTKPSQSPSERSSALGCMGDLASELESAILPHWPTVFLPICLESLADSHTEVRRNAAFTVGTCCEHLQQSASGDYHRILQALSPLFSETDAPGTVDNAAAAIARMIMASPQHVTPMEQILPVLCKALPLKQDMDENEVVYKCLTGLLQMKHPAVDKAELSRIFTAACAPESKVDAEIQAKLREVQGLLQ